jgi:hypothetical protein
VPVNNVPQGLSASAPLLLTDGSVLIHDADATDWWKLTPDAKGNYTTGTWKQVASPPDTYGPQYYASAVLPDGKVVVIGGEYNVSNSEVWTNLGYTSAVKVATVITIHASCGGVTVSNTFTVEAVGIAGLRFNYASVNGGTTLTGTVVFSSALGADENVTLKSSDPSVATVPNAIQALAGKSVAYFAVTTKAVTTKTTITITATFNGTETASFILLPAVQ